jgi:hypothetical protein
MTQPAQPAQPAQPTPQPVPFQATPEQKSQFFQNVARVAAAVTNIAGQEEPHVATIALLNVLAAAAQHTQWSRDDVIKFFIGSYEQTKATMSQLGVVPGQPLPEGVQERLRALIEANPNKPPQELLQQLLGQAQPPAPPGR